MNVIIPELNKMKGFDQKNPNHCFDLYDHTMKVVEGVADTHDDELKIAAMLHDIGKMTCFTETEDGTRKYFGHAKVSAEIAEEILKKEGLPEDMVERIRWIINEHETDMSSKKSMKKRLESGGEELVRKVLILRRADIRAQAPEVQEEHMKTVDAAEKTLRELLAEVAEAY